MLILTKIKLMKAPVSRRLKTRNDEIFTDRCPFGCDVEDNEEHALLYCKTSIIKNVENYILKDLELEEIKNKIKNLWIN